ncbi:Acetate kinase [Tolypocladium capitatum]|uniref:Acetate kinase n=1 Tax=Tolypocladium capitatum TaxID=45235 RepID=A0A2K3QDX4_9HYPO|nr:Acetate kinase [Tolypocladium capitatum]
MAAASSSSGSSFTSSSLGRPPTYGRSYHSPVDSAWTPTSGISSVSAPSTGSAAPLASSLRPLDLGPPGYRATITLFQDTPDERTVYLGPWEVVGSEQRRVLWQCSYRNELLEHYLPSDVPSDIHPHTLHSRHRQYHDPSDMERYLTFTEPHRIRYTTDEGVCIHDQYIPVRYEFTTIEASVQFQGDLRRRDMINYFDVDVAWTNVHGRTDGFGNVKGIGAIQRLKMWRDRYTTFHSVSVLANKTDGQYHEYDVHIFEGELRGRDDRAKQLRLNVAGRRGSAPAEDPQRRHLFAQRLRPRVRSTGQAGHEPPSPWQTPVDIRYLSLQFSSRQGKFAPDMKNRGSEAWQLTAEADHRRFLEAWLYAHSSDREFRGVPFPPNHFELPSSQMLPGQASEPTSPKLHRGLDTVPEPDDQDGGG